MRIQIRIPDSDVSVYFPAELLLNRGDKTPEDLIKQRRKQLDEYEEKLKSKQTEIDERIAKPSDYNEYMDQILTRLEICKLEKEALALLEKKIEEHQLDYEDYDPFAPISASQISLSSEELDLWRKDESLEEKLAKIPDIEISLDQLVKEVRNATRDKKPLPVVTDPNIVQQIVSAYSEGGESKEPFLSKQQVFKKITDGKREIQEIIKYIRSNNPHNTIENKEKLGVITTLFEEKQRLKEIDESRRKSGISEDGKRKLEKAYSDADQKVKQLETKIRVIKAVLDKENELKETKELNKLKKIKEIEELMSRLKISPSEQANIRQAHFDADEQVKVLVSEMSDETQPSSNEDIDDFYVELEALSGFKGRDNAKLKRELFELIEAEAPIADSDLDSDGDFDPEAYLSLPSEMEFSESAKRLRDICIRLLAAETRLPDDKSKFPLDYPLSYSQRLELVSNAIKKAEPELGILESIWLFFKKVIEVISYLNAILQSEDSTQEFKNIKSKVEKEYRVSKADTEKNAGYQFLQKQRKWHLTNEGEKYERELSALIGENKGKEADFIKKIPPSVREKNKGLEEKIIGFRAERQRQVDDYEQNLNLFLERKGPIELLSYLTPIPPELRSQHPGLEKKLNDCIEMVVKGYRDELTRLLEENKIQQANEVINSIPEELSDYSPQLESMVVDRKVELASQLADLIEEKSIYSATKLLNSIPSEILSSDPELDTMRRKIQNFKFLSDQLATELPEHVDKREIHKQQLEQLSTQLREHVAKGEISLVKQLLISPEVLLNEGTHHILNILTDKGPLTDDAGRQFDSISPFLYALWAKDTGMIDVFLEAIPENEEGGRIKHALSKQYDELKSHGVNYTLDNKKIKKEIHFNLRPLQDALRESALAADTYLDVVDKLTSKDSPYDKTYKNERQSIQWTRTVGKEQRKLPAHIVNAYCCGQDGPLFSGKSTSDYVSHFQNTETEKLADWWSKGGAYELGKNLGIVRGNHKKEAYGGSLSDFHSEDMKKMKTSLNKDMSSLVKLDKMRTEEIAKLKERLQPVEPAPKDTPRMGG